MAISHLLARAGRSMRSPLSHDGLPLTYRDPDDASAPWSHRRRALGWRAWARRYPRRAFAAAYGAFYFLAVLWTWHHSSADPTSWFFRESTGYSKHYSLVREAEADAFLAAANSATDRAPGAGDEPTVCLGVATVKRDGKQYVRHTVGSLLEGLSAEERRDIHFVFMIAHVNRSVHPVHAERWAAELPDTVLTYRSGVSSEKLAEIAGWEASHEYEAKAKFDYSYLLQACFDTGAPYVAMIEGDALAAKGWYPYARRAAQFVDDHYSSSSSSSSPSSPDRPQWLYLRLFYTENLFGWNSEFWPSYLLSSLALALAAAALLVLARTLLLLRPSSPRAIVLAPSSRTLALLSAAYLAPLVLLYFAAGRASVRPLPAGPQLMPDYGCCSQGFVFARAQLPLVRRRIAAHPAPYVDMMMEQVAADERLDKWAVAPSLLQHVGARSSKADPEADRNARRMWNFAFERYGSDGLAGGAAGW